MSTKDHSQKYRTTKKTRAAQQWGCRVEELTEIREHIPEWYKDRILKYIGRLKK